MNSHTKRWLRTAAAVISGAMIAVTLPALAAVPASAATQTVTITPSGFVPMDQTIKTGDTVTFTNADTAAHEVQFKTTAGFTCTATPLVIQPSQKQSCTWTVAGKYAYTDPNQRAANFNGTITVDATQPVVTGSVTLAADTNSVQYGRSVNLTGKITPATAGTTVDLLAMTTGQTTYTKVASAVSTAGGVYTLAVTPEIQTNYRAEFQNGNNRVASTVAVVQVRPRVGLALRSIKGVRAYFTVKVTSSQTYEGSYVLVQRKNNQGRWTTIKKTTLGAFSSDRFSVRIQNGTTRIRVLLPAAQAGAGYLSAASRTIAVSR